MNDFLTRCRDDYRVGLTQNEKEWLRTFYYDVEKCIRQNESEAEFVEVCLAVLRQIKYLRSVGDAEDYPDWLPVSQQVVPLNTLFSNDVCGGSLCSLLAEECSISEYKFASKLPFILLGYLTSQPKSLKSRKASGTLYVEDNLTAVVCEIINPSEDYLEKLLLIPHWNYVPSSSSSAVKEDVKNGHGGYLEIIKTGTPIVVTKTNVADNKLSTSYVLSVKEFQEQGSSTINLNIQGSIFALSPIHSMSVGKPFFLVKIFCTETSLTTSLVIQGEQFMLWHNFLQINEQYVFHNLREVEEEVKAAAEISMGTEISEEDMNNIIYLCDQIIEMTDYRAQLYDYLKNRMTAIAPNLTVLVGELVGARLIAHAGSLLNLAKHPSSTVQILGAEKALFRALKTKRDTPKYGLIFHASLVGQTNPKHKGKISRMLAAKVSLAARVDALGEDSGTAMGVENRAKLEMRLKALEENQLRRISGTGKAKARVDKYENKSVVMSYNPATDSTIATPGKKRKRSEENGDSTPGDSVPVTPSTPVTEEVDGETPAKKSKKEKKKKKKKNEESKDEDDEEQLETSAAVTPKSEEKKKKKKKKEKKEEVSD